MADKLDVIIFGATGYTGRYVVKDAVELLKDFTWGIAGRNKGRLENVLRDVGAQLKKDLSQIPVILADVDDESSIRAMAARGKAVINCCGPYQLFGEVVVKACVEAGTHHIDISGEPQYINKITYKYDELAKEKGAYVVSTCGFESLPADLGVVYAEQQFDGTVNSVEMFIENKFKRLDKSSKAVLHSGTWESAIYALKNSRELIAHQRRLRKQKLPRLKPKLRLHLFSRKVEPLKSYMMPFPLTDRDVVNSSQRYFYKHDEKRPVQFEAYMGFPSLFTAILFQIITFFLLILSQFAYTRKLLLKYPQIFTGGLCSHEGPLDVNADAQFFTFSFKVKGWSKGTTSLSVPPNKKMWVRVSGYNPFYGFTSVGMICAAKIMLRENKKMPSTGGVLPPAAAFAKTSMIEELSKPKFGVKFEVVN